ncbi:MAG: GGDEF domain-containing protein [Lachnospiraceae bacterium]|jgi:diguanylate cyclase (GGDEF)-like protein|nr:GGDEF domain-containing protein [Lachnospiraceae bacterium]
MEQNTSPKGFRIRTLNYCLILGASILYIFLIHATLQISQKYEHLLLTTADYIACQKSAAQVEEGSDFLTEQVRLFAVTQDLTYADAYFKEAYETRKREHALERLELNVTDAASLSYLQTALDNSNRLMERELYSIKLVAAANGYPESRMDPALLTVELTAQDRLSSPEEKLKKAQSLVFDASYTDAKALIKDNTSYFITNVLNATLDHQATSQNDLELTITRQRIYISLLFIMNVLTFLMIIILVIKPLRIYIKNIRDDRALELIGSYEFRYLALTYNNIYEINAANYTKMRKKAELDPLTGIMNRGAFEQLKERLRIQPLPMALLLIDVDNFKTVNDENGHEIGDKVLKKVAGLLTSSFRPSDFAIRIGGDEFAVVMTDIQPDLKDAVIKKAEQINRILLSGEDGLPRISLSIGVAFSPSGFHDELFRNADSALYIVKQNGRCGCHVYEEPARTL